MATIKQSPNQTTPPRKSAETERQQYAEAASIAPSESASMVEYNEEGESTPRRARSTAETLTSTSDRRPYRGFPSEEAYLAALYEWAESRKYTSYDTSLIGFYGQTTGEQYARQPRPEYGFGLRKKWKARKERKAEGQLLAQQRQQQGGEPRRNTVA